MPGSRFAQRRSVPRPPPTCKSSYRQGRMAETPNHPAQLTGIVQWLDLTQTPPINFVSIIDVDETAPPTEYIGSVTMGEVSITVTLGPGFAPELYDILIEIVTPTWSDDDSFHDLPRPDNPCEWDTGDLANIHTPNVDEVSINLST